MSITRPCRSDVFDRSISWIISGSVAAGWEPLRAAFERNFERNLELGAQLAVYKDGDLVVDLHGCAPAAADYDGDTLQNVFSSGKNLEAIAVSKHTSKYHGLKGFDRESSAPEQPRSFLDELLQHGTVERHPRLVARARVKGAKFFTLWC